MSGTARAWICASSDESMGGRARDGARVRRRGLPRCDDCRAGRPATRDTVEQWLTQNASAKPDFKPGHVLTAKDLERLRLLIPPVYIDQLNFPQLKMEIVAARSQHAAQGLRRPRL